MIERIINVSEVLVRGDAGEWLDASERIVYALGSLQTDVEMGGILNYLQSPRETPAA